MFRASQEPLGPDSGHQSALSSQRSKGPFRLSLASLPDFIGYVPTGATSKAVWAARVLVCSLLPLLSSLLSCSADRAAGSNCLWDSNLAPVAAGWEAAEEMMAVSVCLVPFFLYLTGPAPLCYSLRGAGGYMGLSLKDRALGWFPSLRIMLGFTGGCILGPLVPISPHSHHELMSVSRWLSEAENMTSEPEVKRVS